jgi:hypothetical protein
VLPFPLILPLPAISSPDSLLPPLFPIQFFPSSSPPTRSPFRRLRRRDSLVGGDPSGRIHLFPHRPQLSPSLPQLNPVLLMEPGSLGLDSRVLHQLKTRALLLVRSSRDPGRCLQVMRARAAAFFDSGNLGVVASKESVEEGRSFVVRLDSAPPVSLAVFDKKDKVSTTEPVEQPPIDDVVTDGNCSGFTSLLKIVPQLRVESKASMGTGCTGGDVQHLSTCQDVTLLLMDIRSERKGRQAEEFRWPVMYPIFIFIFDPGELISISTLSSMPLDMRNEKFGKALNDWLEGVEEEDDPTNEKAGLRSQLREQK